MNKLTIRKALNKAFLKVKPNRTEMNDFKQHLHLLLTQVNPTEHEEFNKNLLADFLKNTFYAPNHFINTKGRNDLVIHHDKSAKSKVGVIIEAKRPDNMAEMPIIKKTVAERPDRFQKPVRSGNVQFDLNCKAVQELVLYYLRERITEKNDKVKHLIVTDAQRWFVFDEQEFYKHFAKDKKLVKAFEEFERGTASSTSTDYFYKNIAKPAIEKIQNDLIFTYFDIRDFKKIVLSDDKELDKKLIPLFKILSPEHLLKLPFANDSNTLDKRFYNELLHIIGLHETGKSKKTIKRLPKGKRNAGSLLENTIEKLDSTNKIHRLKNVKRFGHSYSEQLEAVALELVITWVNRILFLKLLEAQLLSYHKGNTDYAFLNFEKLRDYDEVEVLFFEVLAKETDKRSDYNQRTFGNVPYLNSSLFEPTELENDTLEISGLRDRYNLPLHSATVLKDDNGKRLSGEQNTLQYFLAFLDAYDFASEGTEDIQEQQKSIINAAVLGLIFEKINGYKDGSFFTPGFITMYMCRETLRRAVVQKFKEAKGWNCDTFQDLKEDLSDFIRNHPKSRGNARQEANELVNSLKICDPAVGSGHFLVSALNELITIKFDLNILQDEQQQRIDEFIIKIENDELVVENAESGELFNYQPNNPKSQRIQKMLFHEKQTIIENCLFGVDINPNSVKICRLRLWIELLKNAYYKNNAELETLPNIDINIKTGNSLISRFALDTDLKDVLKKNKSKWTISTYRNAVATYRIAKNKEEKRAMRDFINTVKADFQKDIYLNDPKNKQLKKLLGERMLIENKAAIGDLFEKLSDKDIEKDLTKINKKIDSLEAEINDIRNNVIYQNAFEWRFEFPEVLNDAGDFVGFDVVIGNPPYISHDRIDYRNHLQVNYDSFEAFSDLYCYFFEKGISLTKTRGILNFITSNSFLKTKYGEPLRKLFNRKGQFLQLLNLDNTQVFDDATVNTIVAEFQKGVNDLQSKILNAKFSVGSDFTKFVNQNHYYYSYEDFQSNTWSLLRPNIIQLGNKIRNSGKTLLELNTKIRLGLATGSNKAFVLDAKKANELIIKDVRNKDIIKPVVRGRDISRFTFKQEKFILLTKNGIDVENDYPTIYNYLNSFGEKFKTRGAKGKHWTNLRACSFFDDFLKPKIIWIELTDNNRFTLSNEEVYLLNSAYFMIPPDGLDTEYLLGILNSKLIKFYLKLIANTSGVGTLRWINEYVKQFPIVNDNNTKISNLVTEILAQKKENPKADTSALELEIDAMVYALYGLTEAEILLIENG